MSAMFNLDRTKNIIGKEVYDAIGAANQSQLEKWLSDLQHELKYFATPEDARYNKLKHEEQLIMYRLGLKMESKMKKSHPLQENYERFFGKVNENSSESEPKVIAALRDIVDTQLNKKVLDPKSGKKMLVDFSSARAVTLVYDALSPENNVKFVDSGLLKMVSVAWKMVEFKR